MKYLFSICLAFVVSGCSTTWNPPISGVSIQHSEYVKSQPQRATRGAGEIIIHSWPTRETERIRLENDVTGEVSGVKKLMGGFSVKSYNFRIEANKGDATLLGRDDSGATLYKLSGGVLWGEAEMFNGRRAPGGVRLKNGEATLYWAPPYLNGKFQPITDLKNTPEIREDIPPNREDMNFSGFGQTITYIGKTGGLLNFVYKEFDDRSIRSAFTQEFSVDYKPGESYAFKGARFIVHEASQDKLTYSVLSGF